MLKKVIFGAALVMGFVTSFQFGRSGQGRDGRVVHQPLKVQIPAKAAAWGDCEACKRDYGGCYYENPCYEECCTG